MVLLKEGFARDLLKTGDYKKNPMADIDNLLSALPEDEQKARKEEYLLDLRIMKAASMDDVADITFEQVLDCISSSGIFADFFELQKAKFYLQRFEAVRSVRTQRKRRIL